MDKQEYIFKAHRKRGRKATKPKPIDLDYIHKKNGYYDGKIFYTYDKVTYTFVDKEDVMVLHFDLSRGTLFLRGHKIQSIDMYPGLELYLSRFKKCLMDNPKTERFVKPFDALITALCNTN